VAVIRANLTSIVALARPIRMVPVEEFDLMVGELEELRRRERECVDLAYAERAAVVAWLRDVAETMNHNGDKCCGRVEDLADSIERGEHRREEER
tara:strand:+ start:4982 stop:5266 length:285 start_codon:yes stop_codon:yes gene_type:complete